MKIKNFKSRVNRAYKLSGLKMEAAALEIGIGTSSFRNLRFGIMMSSEDNKKRIEKWLLKSEKGK